MMTLAAKTFVIKNPLLSGIDLKYQKYVAGSYNYS